MIAELEVNWRQSLIPTWQEMLFSMKIRNPLVQFQLWTWQDLNIPALQKKASSSQTFSWNIQEHEVKMETRGRGL